MTHKYTPPIQTEGDFAHAMTKGAAGAIPIFGSIASELFNSILAPPWARRHETWMGLVGEAVHELEQHVGSLDYLRNNETFVSIVAQATKDAMMTHEKNKLLALKNAVMNAALPVGDAENIFRLHMVKTIGDLTATHLHALRIMYEPFAWFEENGLNTADVDTSRFGVYMPEVIRFALGLPQGPNDGDKALPNQLIKELAGKGLVADSASSGGYESFERVQTEKVHKTELGQKTIDFMKAPNWD